MPKVEIDKNAFVYPMPVTLVGAVVDGKPNFLAVAWMSKVNYNPSMVGIALSSGHHTTRGIIQNGVFSVNIPGVDMMEVTDYCGLVSGSKADKSGLFEVFYGSLDKAPMISQCPLCIECKLVQTVELPKDNLFIGEIVGVFCDEGCITDGKPDIRKINPFILSMTDSKYISLGEDLAKAWSVGKGFQQDQG